MVLKGTLRQGVWRITAELECSPGFMMIPRGPEGLKGFRGVLRGHNMSYEVMIDLFEKHQYPSNPTKTPHEP